MFTELTEHPQSRRRTFQLSGIRGSDTSANGDGPDWLFARQVSQHAQKVDHGMNFGYLAAFRFLWCPCFANGSGPLAEHNDGSSVVFSVESWLTSGGVFADHRSSIRDHRVLERDIQFQSDIGEWMLPILNKPATES